MRQLPKAFLTYRRVVSVIGAAIFLAALGYLDFGRINPLEAGLFLLLVFVAECTPVVVPGTYTGMYATVPILLAIFLSHGTAAAVVISSIALLGASFVTQRGKSISWFLPFATCNTAHHIIGVLLASLAFLYAGGQLLADMPAESGLGLRLILHLVLWVMTYELVVGGVMCTIFDSLYSSESWRLSVQRNLRWSIPNYIVSVPFGVMFASLYLTYGMHGIFLVIIPFLVARQALNLHARHLSTYRETITALGTYVQHHHLYTLGHLERVADLSKRIARQMHLPVRSLTYIRDAGLLHDIGKVGVDEEILDKTGQLTDDDWATIKQHPARGAEILAQMKYLECIVPWVRGHHERPDGRGYPDGLQDGQIPIEAAVMGVADAYDAMIGGPDEKERRVYRTPLTVDQAADQVRYGTGSQFDAKVVKAFLAVMARKAEKTNE